MRSRLTSNFLGKDFCGRKHFQDEDGGNSEVVGVSVTVGGKTLKNGEIRQIKESAIHTFIDYFI